MSEYLSDREQEEALRSWWRENWRWVLAGVAVGFALLAGWNFYRQHVQERGESAAQTYNDLTAALQASDKDKAEAAVKKLDAEFADSPYTDQAHLLMAQAHVGGGRFEMAATELKTVVDRSKDAALAQVARLRLARVQMQLGRHDDALAMLDVNKAGKFVAQVHELRGDALLAKGDSAGARAAYQAAVTATREVDPRAAPGGSEYLQLKLQDLLAATSANSNASSQAQPTPAAQSEPK